MAHELGLKDELSKFLDQATKKGVDTPGAVPDRYARLVEIDDAFMLVQQNLNYSDRWFVGLMFLRSHSAFRAAVRLALSGQLPEAYAIMRGAIENAMYGLHFDRNYSSIDTWLQRNNDPQTLKKAKDAFKYHTVKSTLSAVDKRTSELASRLYDLAIDQGGHPNQRSLMGSLRIIESTEKTEVKVAYLSGDRLGMEVCLKSVAETGICCLQIFGNAFEKRFAILGIPQLLAGIVRRL